MDGAVFFAALRKNGIFGPKLEQSEVDGCNAVLDSMKCAPVSHAAYALATAIHETNKTMMPVVEAYWLTEAWRKANLRYYPWHGRGYVQLTWEANYRKADDKLGLKGALVKNPELAMKPDIAARIMRRGMDEGWFTGKTLSGCLPQSLGTSAQFKAARKIINGTDKDTLIASYAKVFQDALVESGW